MTTHAARTPERALCGMTREDHDALANLEPRSPFRLLPAGERPRCRYCRAKLDAQSPPDVHVPDAVPDSDGAARRLSVLLSLRAEATGRRAAAVGSILLATEAPPSEEPQSDPQATACLRCGESTR